MKNNIKLLNKFYTMETEFIINQEGEPLLSGIDKLNFLEPSPGLRKYMILNSIASDHNITQSKLSKEVHIVPAMINKYIYDFRRKGIIRIEGTHHRNTKYYLTKRGEDLRKKFLYDFIEEILILYKEIKEEIKIKLQKLGLIHSDKILLFGAGEIAELMVQSNEDINLNIVGIIDSDEMKIGNNINGFKILEPEKINDIGFDIVLITSISKRHEIYKKIKYLEKKDKKIVLFAEI